MDCPPGQKKVAVFVVGGGRYWRFDCNLKTVQVLTTKIREFSQKLSRNILKSSGLVRQLDVTLATKLF